jgi:hypothetical protein
VLVGKQTKLVAACREAERAIERATQNGKGAHKTRNAMLCDLARWVIAVRLSRDFERLRRLRLPWKRWDSELSQPGVRLASALHWMDRQGASRARAISLSGAADSEVGYFLDLLKRTGLHLTDIVKEQDPFIKTEIAAQSEEMHVRLEGRALEDILLAAAEAHLASRTYAEVFGICFGGVRGMSPTTLSRRLHVNVTRVVTQMRARANAREVTPNWRSHAAHLDVADRYFPHLEVVGEYHTHPCRSLAVLEKEKGWEYSSGDESSLSYVTQRIAERKSNPRFSLVVGVARGGRAGSKSRRRGPNIIQVAVEDLFFVIGAYRIRLDATYDHKLTLHVPTML